MPLYYLSRKREGSLRSCQLFGEQHLVRGALPNTPNNPANHFLFEALGNLYALFIYS